MISNRTYLIAVVNAQLKAQQCIEKFTQEFEPNGNPNQPGSSSTTGQTNNAQRNVPPVQQQVQQSSYGG